MRKNRNTIFAGAGISLDSPSNLPISKHIIDKILQAITPNNNIKDKLLKFSRGTHTDKLFGDFIRFEMLLDVISDIDPKLEVLNFIRDFDTPNLNHYNLAKAAITGDYIITPNFDCLIEKAILNLGYEPITICYNKDFENWKVKHNKKQIPIFKIHGSFFKYTGISNKRIISRTSIQATLSSVSSNKVLFKLRPSKFNFLKNVVESSNNLIIVGYSGNDDFDIIPSLYNIKPQKLIWIKNSKSYSKKNCIKDKINEILLKKENERDQSERYILDQYSKTSLVYYKTLPSEYLSNYGGLTKIPIHFYISTDKFNISINEWKSKYINKGIQYLLSGELLYRLSDYINSQDLFKKAIKESISEHQIILSKLNTISSLTQLSHFKKAKKYLSLLSTQYNLSLYNQIYCDSLHKLAYLNSRILKNSNTDINEQFKKAIYYSERYKQNVLLCNCYNDYALFLHDIGEINNSIKYFKLSFNLGKLIGNIRHTSWSSYNLAGVYYDIGKYELSLEYNLQSIKLSTTVGDFKLIGFTKNLSGLLYFIKGDLLLSRDSFKECLKFDSILGNEKDSAVTWMFLGQVYLELDNKIDALKCFDQSLDTFNNSDDNFDIFELHFLRAIYYLKYNNINQAEVELSYLQKSIKTYKANLIFKTLNEIISFKKDNKYNINIMPFINEIYQMGEKSLFLNVIYYVCMLKIPKNKISKKFYNYSLSVYDSTNNTTRKKKILKWKP
ncbi:MAG: SIR2 family protein [Chitinophagales bacterium]